MSDADVIGLGETEDRFSVVPEGFGTPFKETPKEVAQRILREYGWKLEHIVEEEEDEIDG
jgi:hypothetical protein